MEYPDCRRLRELCSKVELYTQLQFEYGARQAGRKIFLTANNLAKLIGRIRALPIDRVLAANEPDTLSEIRWHRPEGPRTLWKKFDPAVYRDRVEGAMLARFAGCTLGAPVEGWKVSEMEDLARELGEAFPPEDYWSRVPRPLEKRYGVSLRGEYTRGGMDGVPVDDDIAYTLLGLLIVEDFGPGFTVADVGRAWLKYLPMACTAEDVALANLKKGVPAEKAGEIDNPYCQWIGADIRSDPWGYMAPGRPELAAGMAWRDAFISHRRNGIYGEMFFSAAIAAAFAVDDPMAAVEIGLSEIPRDCSLAGAVRWALKLAPKVRGYRQARAAVDEKFAGMSHVHTINNACLTIFGLAIGGRDVTKVIGQTVAMGMDNDCTAATAGSIVGAVVGRRGVPRQWTRSFNNTVHSYLIGRRKFTIDGLVDRFAKQAKRVFAAK
ncbi:MAG: ADP-ribosylglycohydrolase family protein [Phycisphaerae bacterium]